MAIQYEVRQALATMEGDGAEVKPLMPIPGFMNFDPIVLWDHFDLGPGTGFPDHPHRGFEAITYLFQGSMQHADNLGNRSTVAAGGVQRFTAGRGLVHSEMPAAEGHTDGIQLWINLPGRLKGVEPTYQQVDAEQIPEQQFEGGRRRVIVGADSPVKLLTPVYYCELQLEAGAELSDAIQAGHRGLVYVVSGEVSINEHALQTAQSLFCERETTLQIHAASAAHLMLCFGQPHGEPIKQYGPFVD